MTRMLARLPMLALSTLVPFAAGCSGSSHSKTTSAGAKMPTVSASSNSPTSEAVGTGSAATVPISYESAESAFRGGRYPEATELFTVYTRNNPDNAWGYYMLGLSSWKAGEHEKAGAAFDRALQLDPSHRKSLFNSSRVLLETGRPQEALERIEKGLSLEPISNEGLRLLGRVRYELGKIDEAIEAYHRALAIDDRDVWSMNNLGLIYIQRDRSCDALPPLARAVELRGNAPVFQNNLGTALERSGYPTAAAQAYEAAIGVDSSYGKAAVALARVTSSGQKPESSPVDLVRLSQQFQAEIETWRGSTAEADSSAASDQTVSDTTGPVSTIDDSTVAGGSMVSDTLEECASELDVAGDSASPAATDSVSAPGADSVRVN
jgi:tetratricopeptide (TPR) repeat protein